jgi:preprotein translocase subunit SecB
MEIQLINSNIHSLNIERHPSKMDEEKNLLEKKFDLEYQTYYEKENDKIFGNIFIITIIHPGDFELKMKFISWFKTSESITDEFKTSNFTLINAPAIAFPYLRSAVSVITMTAGYGSVILPTLNFVKMGNQKKS